MKHARLYATIVIALIVTIAGPIYATDNARTGEPSNERAARNNDPVDEWLYWQQHYDEIEAAAVDSSEPRITNRGIASEIEGCKIKQKVEIYQTVWCMQDALMYTWANELGIICSTTQDLHCTGGYGCEDWTTWVPKETGEKCYTLGATIDISAFLQTAHAPSTSMQLWLEQQLNAPPGGYTYPGGYNFTAYEQQFSGTSSCTSSSTTQTWTTSVGHGYSFHHQVKIWSASQSGSGCDPIVTITP